MSERSSVEVERGSRVRVDLSVRFEDVGGVVEADVYRVTEDESLPYHIEFQGTVARISAASVIEVIE